MQRFRGWCRTAVLVSIPGLALAACGDTSSEVPGDVLATFAGGEVTRAEFDTYVERQASAGRSLTEGEGDWRVAVLEEIAVTEMAAAAVPDTPAVEAAVNQARGVLLDSAIRQRLGWNEVTVTNEEVRRYYDENPEIFLDPEKLRLQHIFLRAERDSMSADERAAVRQRLEGIRQEVVAGADFAAMAKLHSDSADGPAGGWMVLKRGARAVRSFVDAAWALEEGEVTEPIDTPIGFHIARLAARIAPVERPFDDVRQFVTTELIKVTTNRIQADYLAEKESAHGVERYYEALDRRDTDNATPIFRVEGDAFTFGDLVSLIPDSYLPHVFTGYEVYVHRFLDQQILGRILVREAEAEGLADDEEFRVQIEHARREFRASLEIERRLAERSQQASESEILDFYEQNKNRFETLRRRSVSVIRLPLERDRNLWALLKYGEKLVQEIRGGAEFSEVARRESNHLTADEDGRLLDQTDDDLRLQVQSRARGRRVIDELELGEVSAPFVGEVYDPHTLRFEATGVYIVRLDDETLPRQGEMEEVEELVRANYLRRYYSRELSEVKDEMLAEGEFEVIDANLPELGT